MRRSSAPRGPRRLPGTPRALTLGALWLATATGARADLALQPAATGRETFCASQRLGRGSASEDPDPPALEDPFGEEQATRAAIRRGLGFLATQQARESDGSLPSVGTRSARLAVTALGALAYMSAGNGPGRGPHGQDVSRAIDYLLSRVDRNPTSARLGYISDAGDKTSQMHGHGFATLALAEAYSVSPRSDRGARIAQALRLAVDCIERSQSLEGGWYYEPVRGLEHEGSITIALVQALRAAKGAGLHVDPQVIAKAEDYVRRSQAENGAFRYAIGNERVTVALTAAAISTLNAAGEYHGSSIQQGYDYIERELRAREAGLTTGEQDLLRRDGSSEFPYYERLYLAQAYWQNPDRTVFEGWIQGERRRVLREQNADGSWSDPRFGATYATAINVLVLALPDQLLPIFQR
jgi:hypothetical protein